MVLADTSVWIEHLRHGHAGLTNELDQGMVFMHPFVFGELACGNLRDRPAFLSYFNSLIEVKLATHDEALQLLDHHSLWGRGLGWIDIHLLASAILTDCRFWTLDKRLAQAADDLRLS